MLWCVELRTPDPYCPIDLSYEGGEIVISQAEPVDRPLRLGVDEASALLVALRMLAEVGHPVSRLVRISVGPIKLGNLTPGSTRDLSTKEIGELYAAVGL